MLDALYIQWLADGDSRSITLIAARNNVPPGELVQHAQKFEWHARLTKHINLARARTEDEAVEVIADINRRHLRMLRKIGKEAEDFLTNHKFDKPADAARAAFQSIEMERGILGIGEKTEDVASVVAKRMAENQKAREQRKPKITVTPAEPTKPALPAPKEPEFKFEPDFKADEPPPDDAADLQEDTDAEE